MRQLYSCIAEQHDLWLVAIAAMVCAIGCYATFATANHAFRANARALRWRWGAAMLLTTTSTIWSTHFIAMLAFHVPFPSGFLVGRTILSFVVALAIVGAACAIALLGRSRTAATVAGLTIGLAISAMHFTGMSAFRAVGSITWDPATVVVSIVIGVVFCALAGRVAWDDRASRVRTSAALLLVAVCGDHFVAMSAATLAFDPSVTLPGGLITGTELAPIVAGIAAVIVCMVLAAHRLHLESVRRRFAERKRFQDIADFAVEGLLICDGDRVVWASHSIEAMTGATRGAHVGRSLDALFTHAVVAQFENDREVDTVLGSGDDATPVRVIRKPIVLEARPHTVIAVRDQRERLRAETEMRRLADCDPLTGLANRQRFNDTLEQMITSRRVDGRDFALLSLDLDRFKYVNDAHGHAAGDALLMRVAGRLAAVVRDGTMVARIGGDEFSILAKDHGDEQGIRALADRVVEVLSRPFLIDGQIHEIGASVGVALAPGDGDTASALIRSADLALYRAKEDGRGVYRMFEPGMNARMQARRSLELALRRAAARQEFLLHYQPQVDTVTGAFVGAEALIRWMDPERGMVSPLEFIQVAEETNLIVGIGEWVLHTACAEAATWPAHLTIAVNLSPVQFRDPRLFSIVVAALEESGLAPQRLELEITESALIDDETAVLALLQGFKQLGVMISLDDFGTGYSSLSHLSRFPFDKIKIDRSFVSRAPDDRDSAAIVRAIVSLGTSLGIATTAEGVETERQRKFVADAGCDRIQGYLYARPTPAALMPSAFKPVIDARTCPSSDCSITATAT